MYHYFNVWSSRQSDLEDPLATEFHKRISYAHFRLAWYAFLALLDLQYDEGFQCPHCGPIPSIIVGDATALAFRQDYDSWKGIISSGESVYCAQQKLEGR